MISVYILTGFLGAGKTTVMNNLLQSFKHQKNTVIENEFGETSVDGHLINSNIESLFDLNNGCICCSLENELFEVLNQIATSKSLPDNVFIETTGIADVGEVISLFKTEIIKSKFELKKTICIVDSETIEDRINDILEAVRQIVMSDCIILNKTGFISQKYLVSVHKLISDINSTAPLITTKDGKIDVAILNEEKEQAKFKFKMQYSIKGREIKHSIKTITYKTQNEFNILELEFSMRIILQISREQIFRIKGFIKETHSNTKLLVQSAGKRLIIEPFGVWDEERPTSYLVFIGKDITDKAIERILKPSIKISKPVTEL